MKMRYEVYNELMSFLRSVLRRASASDLANSERYRFLSLLEEAIKALDLMAPDIADLPANFL